LPTKTGTHVSDFFDVKTWDADAVRMVATTTAILLMFFVAFMMCIAYMLNYPDPQVMSLSYKLISACIAILCAVLVEKAQFGKFSNYVVIGMVLGDDIHQIHNELELFCVNLVFFLFWVVVLSVALKVNNHSHETLYAIRLFVSHEVAFVGIHMLAGPQERFSLRIKRAEWGGAVVRLFHFGYIWGVMGLLSLISLLGNFARTKVHPPSNPSERNADGAALADGHTEQSHQTWPEMWKEEASEGEDEATAIILSFLTRQSILLCITGRIPTVKGDFGVHPDQCFGTLFGSIFISLALLVLMKKMVDGNEMHESEQHHVPSIRERFAQSWVSYLAFLVSWQTLSLCRWMMQRMIKEQTLMFVTTAGWVSFPLIMAIIGFDFLSDEGWLHDNTALVFIECSGLIIGISWEKAFAMAIDTINHAHVGSVSACIITEMCLCGGLCALLLPGWRWYICPVACKPIPERDRRRQNRAEEEAREASEAALPQEPQGRQSEKAGAGAAAADGHQAAGGSDRGGGHAHGDQAHGGRGDGRGDGHAH